ncbi:MAG: hypothetical protein WC532_06850 [Candidatus Omnitrophota bacterium]
MKKRELIFTVMFLIAVTVANSLAAQQAEWQDIGGGNLRFSAVWVNPDNASVIVAGSAGGIIKTENAGKQWRHVLTVRQQVNFFVAVSGTNLLLAATGNGLYLSRDQGSNWKRVFKGRDYLESNCSSVALFNNRIYLGTKAGLFVSKDNCRSWQKEAGILANSRICTISVDAGNIYAASAQGVFKMQSGTGNWQRVFVPSAGIDNEAPEEAAEEAADEVSETCSLAVDYRKPGHLYLAAAGKTYESIDSGNTWELLPDYGLFDKYINLLLISIDSRLFACVKKGIFLLQDDRWFEVSVGLIAQDIRGLDSDRQGNIYAACNSGLFKGRIGSCVDNSGNKIEALYLNGEPEIDKVQKAAIKYAEVEPEKIIRWRRQAAKKAFMPRFTVGIDRDTGDLWHWESGSSTKTCDDVLMRGRDSIGWDVSLSWDLSEIVWNSEQTSIDTRSRLMVQLRGDILDEVTKLYFERIRVKAELDNLAIEDRKKRFEKELRLRELTAMLDGLTGGYFSRNSS